MGWFSRKQKKMTDKEAVDVAMKDPGIRQAAYETADDLIATDPKMRKAVAEADRLIAMGKVEEAEAVIRRAMESR